MYGTILYPTDGSDESLRALDDALDIAGTYDAVLHALYVVEMDYHDRGVDGFSVDLTPLLEALRAEGELAIEAIETRADDAGVPFVGSIVEGSPVHREILDYAAEHEVDLIVMGTHGRHGLDRWLLGSVAERVVRTSDIPVLTVLTTAGREP